MACGNPAHFKLFMIILIGLAAAGIIALVLVLVPELLNMDEVHQEHAEWRRLQYEPWRNFRYYELTDQIEIVNEWSESRFDFYVRARANAASPCLFEETFGAVEMEFVETALGVDFNDPTSWKQDEIDQRAQDLLKALRDHVAEHDGGQQALELPEYTMDLEWDINDHNRVVKEYEDQLKGKAEVGYTNTYKVGPNAEEAEIKKPANLTRAGAEMFMGVTIGSAAVIGAAHRVATAISDRERGSLNYGKNLIIGIVMLLLILVAVGYGLNGLSGDFVERNEFVRIHLENAFKTLLALMVVVSAGGLVVETCLADVYMCKRSNCDVPTNQSIVAEKGKPQIEKGSAKSETSKPTMYLPIPGMIKSMCGAGLKRRLLAATRA